MTHPNPLSFILSRIASAEHLFFGRAFGSGLRAWEAVVAVTLLVWLLCRFLFSLVLQARLAQGATGGMIVVLNGFPGTGKYTILKRVKALLPADNSSRLVDNHLLIDPVQALYPDRSVAHHALRQKIRDAFLPDIRTLAQEGHTVYMTVCLAADSDRDEDIFREHLALVDGTEVPLIWVNAFCDQNTLLDRVQSPDRTSSCKTKLTDPRVLENLVKKHRLINPEVLGGGLKNLVVRFLKTDGTVEESARDLLEIVSLSSSVEAR